MHKILSEKSGVFCGLFYDTLYLDYIVSNGRMTGHDLTEVLSWHLSGGTEENQKRKVIIAGILAKVLS
jgi:hypothetical protein